MDIKTAFYWDVKANSISFLICKIGKDQFEILSGPDNFIIKSRRPDEFYSEAQGIIKRYFNEIKSIKPRPDKIDIEYRILHSGAPAHVFNKSPFGYQKFKDLTDDRSGFVLELFKEHIEQLEKEYKVILAKQIQSILKKDEFKIILKNLGLINELKKDKYKWYLWSIFLHLSSSLSSPNHDKIRKYLWRPIIDSAMSSRGNETRYEVWLENVL